MRITIQYFEGCPHWKLAEQRLRNVLRNLPPDDISLDYEVIDSLATAERLGFYGSPTILVDGLDPFATSAESIGLSCRVFMTEDGHADAPTEAQLHAAITRRI
jgi:hypothetical protein